jgi:DNA polymerase-3 subunit delta
MQMVEGMAEEYGLSFDSGALDLFVMRTGEQSRQIENELEKLDLFLGEERLVTSDHVRQIVAQTRNGIVFELGTAMGKRQLPLALELLDQLLFQGESPVGVLLAAVVPKVRNLFFAQDLAERFGVKASTSRWGYNDYVRDLGALPASATAHLPKNKEGAVSAYPLFFSSQEAGNFTREELFKAMEDVLIANRRLVTTQIDPKLVIGEFLVRMLRPRTTRSRKARPEPARHSGSAK